MCSMVDVQFAAAEIRREKKKERKKKKKRQDENIMACPIHRAVIINAHAGECRCVIINTALGTDLDGQQLRGR